MLVSVGGGGKHCFSGCGLRQHALGKKYDGF